METGDEIIQVMDRFDFEKVAAYMKLVEWKAPNGEHWSPTHLRTKAMELLETAAEDDHIPEIDPHSGLIAWRNWQNQLVLYFYIESKTSYTT